MVQPALINAKKEIAVAILNWNGAHFLEKFLPIVVANSQEADVFVIDNASNDRSTEFIRTNFPHVKCIQLEQNYGFAEGYNRGLKEISNYNYYVLLNSDVETPSNWLKPMHSFLHSNPKMAACAPIIMDIQRRDYFEYAGAAGGYLDQDAYPFCAGRIFYNFEQNHQQYSKNKEVFWASGAALMIKSEIWEQVDGFDTSFFAHMEEIDLCWRLKNRGYGIGICAESHVFHVGGGTLDRQSAFKTYLNFRNSLFLIVKNHRRSPLLPFIFKRLVLDGIAGIRFLIEGNSKYTLAVLKAHFHFYSKAGTYFKKRKEEKKAWTKPNLYGYFAGSILVSFFLKHKKKFSDLDQTLFFNPEK
jgi:GT2 family glycosyltransferase